MSSVETTSTFKTDDILERLHEVKDPEIPFISVVDLGIVTDIIIAEEKVIVKMTPTFTGCPAIQVMQADIKSKVEEMGFANVDVQVDFSVQWSSNLISEQGMKALQDFGLSTPKRFCGSLKLEDLETAQCPHCGSENTTMKSPFGPTLCRALYHCNNCNQGFEQFKTV